MFTALITAGAYIRIPVPICPFTLQFLFTTLAGIILGKNKGAAATALYVILGLAGLPVFTGGGGIGYVLQPSFGYILGFIAGAFVTGLIVERAKNLGMSTNVWTVNDPEKMKRFVSFGIGAITTNEPLVLRELLGDKEFKN